MSFKTRMLRQLKDFLWMGHFVMLKVSHYCLLLYLPPGSSVVSAGKERPVTVEDHYKQHLCEQKGLTTGGKYREVWLRGGV